MRVRSIVPSMYRALGPIVWTTLPEGARSWTSSTRYPFGAFQSRRTAKGRARDGTARTYTSPFAISPSASRCRASRTFAKMSSPAGTGRRISGHAREPERRFVELRHGGQGVRRPPHTREGGQVGERHHPRAELAPQAVLLGRHLHAEELLERAASRPALAEPQPRLPDPT